jgi:hypothetical protein
VLKYVPGIRSTSNSGSDGIYLSSRGSNLDATNYDMNGIKLMQDGLPVTTADGNNHNRVIDPLSARHATVARGAKSDDQPVNDGIAVPIHLDYHHLMQVLMPLVVGALV